MNLAATILSVVLAVGFLGAGAIKLIGNKTSLEMRDRVNVGAQLWRVIGALEVAGAVGLLVGLAVPALGIAAAVGLSLLLIGAVGAHLRANDARNAPPAVLLLLLALALVVFRFLALAHPAGWA
jgi:uncharacterized membrane protein YphA (DoxX/SURF4 family)